MPKAPWLFAIVLVGCARSYAPASPELTALWEERERERRAAVHLTVNPDQVKGCKSLGVIMRDGWSRVSPDQQLRVDTLKLGGDAALLVTNDNSTGSQIGEAYLCAQ